MRLEPDSRLVALFAWSTGFYVNEGCILLTPCIGITLYAFRYGYVYLYRREAVSGLWVVSRNQTRHLSDTEKLLLPNGSRIMRGQFLF